MNDRGHAIEATPETIAGLLAAGYHIESDVESGNRVINAAQQEQLGGALGTANAFLQGAASGATLGATSVASRLVGEGGEASRLKAEHGTANLVGNIVGSVAMPGAGLAGEAGAAVRGTEAGLAREIAGGAIEGAIQNTGQYVSDVALGDKELSAEGFVGAMGSGALFGGGSVGALKISSKALQKARELYPKLAGRGATAAEGAASKVDEFGGGLADFEPTTAESLGLAEPVQPRSRVALHDLMPHGPGAAEAAQVAEHEATNALTTHIDDSEQMLAMARSRMQEGRRVRDIQDGAFGGGPELGASPRAAFTEPPASAAAPEMSLEDQLAETMRQMEGGKSFRKVSAEGEQAAIIAKDKRALDDALAKQKAVGEQASDWGRTAGMSAGEKRVAEAAEALEGSTQDLYELLGRSGKQPKPIAAGEQLASAPPLASRIAAGEAPTASIGMPAPNVKPIDIDEALRDAIGKRGDVEQDLNKAIDVIGRHEQAHADMANALGPEAPMGAQERAKAWYDKLDEQLSKHSEQQAVGAAQMEHAIGGEAAAGAEAAAGKAGGVLKAAELAQNVGTALEVLHSLGVDGIPDPSKLPLIGPVLGLYLKARAMMMVGKRIGMKLPQTAETVIASKAAATQTRIAQAVDKILDASSRAVGAAAPKAAQPSAVLGHVLFDDRQRKTTPQAQGKTEDERNLAARREELSRALQPGAIEESVRNRVRAADPELIAAISATVRTKMEYLDGKIPKPPIMPGMLPGANASWRPAPGQVISFSRSVHAVDDPAGVLEHLADTGQVTYEAADALRNVYPKLFSKAQEMVLLRAQDTDKPLPYARRVALSILFRVPLDGTMQPGFSAAMSAGYQAPQGPPQGTAPGASPVPGMTGDVSLGSRYTPKVDQR